MSIKQLLTSSLLLGLVALTACPQPPPPPPVNDDDPKPSITAVSILTREGEALPTTLISGQKIELSASTTGTGDFDSDANWTVTGGGSFEPNKGQAVQFTAPIVTTDQNVTITAANAQDATKTGSATFTVKAPDAVGGVVINLDGGGDEITVGENARLSATVSGINGGAVDPNVTWALANTSVGQLYNLEGEPVPSFIGSSVNFRAAAVGSSFIRATSVQDPNKSATITLTSVAPVSGNAITGIKLEATKVAMFTAQTTTLAAEVLGEGEFSSDVTFTLEAGDGELKTETPTAGSLKRKATFTPAKARTAIISVSSVGDGSVVERIFIGVDPSKKVVSAGANQSLAINNNKFLFAWGSNEFGQLGLGNVGTGDKTRPATVTGIQDLLSVSAGGDFSMAMTASANGGVTKAWGSDELGQIGGGIGNDGSNVPVGVKTPMDSGTVAIDTNSKTALAIRGGGAVYCWGLDSSGQCNGVSATGSIEDRPIKIELEGIVVDVDNPKKPVVGVAAGCEHSLFSDDKGLVYGWGKNTNNQLGAATTGNNKGKKIAITTNFGGRLENQFIAIAAAGQYSLLLTASGRVRVLGKGFPNGNIADLNDIVAITAGGGCGNTGSFAFALHKNGKIFNISNNGSSQISPNGERFVAFSAGDNHLLAVNEDGNLFAFGKNTDGQLGLGDTTDRASLTEVKFSNGESFNLLVP
jgi:alpha-tubulin suppressor-like RCC1 family protein